MSKLLFLAGIVLLVGIGIPLTHGTQADVDAAQKLLSDLQATRSIVLDAACTTAADQPKLLELEAKLKAATDVVAVVAADVTAWTAEFEPLKGKTFCAADLDCTAVAAAFACTSSATTNSTTSPTNSTMKGCGVKPDCLVPIAAEDKDLMLACHIDACGEYGGANNLYVTWALFATSAFAALYSNCKFVL